MSPNAPGTPIFTVRLDPDLLAAAKNKATEKGETVSDVIRRALDRYTKRN